ncbi:MAG: CHASE domain-containing protein, partial [Gammaproteobacteria bacterium]|nr:CHASE domain-containing protein [Gammaproteobacteria bacterium]
VLVVLLVGSAISIGGYAASRHYLERTAQQQFDREASHHVTVVEKAVNEHLAAVRMTAQFFSAAETEVDRWSFWDFTMGQPPDVPGIEPFPGVRAFPGIESLQWIPYVPLENRLDYEAKAQADGLFGFSFSERVSGTGLVKAADRRAYLPVYYVEPTDGNQELLGFDMATMPAVLEALERARDVASLTVTQEIQITVGAGVRRTVMAIEPVYRGRSVPASVDGRRAALRGFVVGMIDPASIVDTTVGLYTTPAWLDMYIYDDSARADGGLLHYRPSQLRRSQSWPVTLGEVRRGRHKNEPIELGDRNWSIVVAPVPGRFDFETDATPYGVAAFGVVITLFLANYFVTQRNRRRLIEEKVAERTSELSAANRSLANEVQERKRVARALRRAKEEAELANHAKSGFLAMISHELRTPLNAIIGFSEILSEQMFGPLGHKKYSGYVKDIRNSGQHLLGLINNILDLTKVEANEFNLRRQTMNLAEAIDEVLRLFEGQARAAAQLIELDLEEPLPPLHADPGAIRQILINLVSNALKFTPDGGLIVVSAKLHGDGRLTIAVSDNGIGIPKEHIDGVFQPFSQVDSSLARRYEGTGLGLPLTKSLVQLHGGDIRIESAPRHGTTVFVTFRQDMVLSQGDDGKLQRGTALDSRLDLH